MISEQQQQEAEQRHLHHMMSIFWWLGCAAGIGTTLFIFLLARELTR